ncbi:hypothetical protein K469DRAFT_678997 [Zopfia rhizophila CBS 207.26]|uniref:Mediator of RNA polymerase II transcription subunit 12 n=1 Tax=Zopfia rhizophila CBS 207.26 TaxID=1314779 RepID=A0A6A6DCI2_9PEZI|nr:hypothetical protein K469DRAFT_678997 [Zopfia rhizophila CBS 207.26]
MTSRPGPGIQESLQRRGSGGLPRPQARRRPSKPVNNPQNAQPQDCIDPNLESERRSAEETLTKSRGSGNTKVKPGHLDGIQTGPNDQGRPPPRGKPQLFFSTLANNGPEPPLQSPHGQTSYVGTNLPIPPRPGSSLHGDIAQQTRRMIPGGSGVKQSATAKPQVPEAPTPAIVFPDGKTADLFPWAGNHPEDTLSEALVKGGISNKPQIMNETNTARVSLWSNLKNKSGLSTLSSLFVAVLEKRQSCGRLTAANTFKPPPRLTLRDSTREAWLHDLANPTVGLRRLSRTIPHGITGKVLLEQCLNKNIPIPRAIWLAKCVGINEMRSHKRKGQAGTITWVRGWTSSVEQFLDSTIAIIGQQDWKPRITYAIQLATQLYKDNLLEGDHFLDWLLKCLDSSVSARLFVWLLLVSVYWQDLTASRRRSKRLAESLLNHAEKIYQVEEEDDSSPILIFLESTIIRLLVTSPASLLLPKTWSKHGIILHRLAEKHSHPRIIQIVADLDRRSSRLLRSSSTTSTNSQNSARKLLSLLDTVDYSTSISIESVSSECMELIADPRSLVSIVLQWASSLHREGMHRIYLATRLLRKWSHVGADVDDGILWYLHSLSSKKNIEPRNVFRVIAELVRSKTFSVGRYLQWLIATGSLSSTQDFSAPSAWPLRLITEIPRSGLPEQVLNLRSTLLQGTGYSVESEDQMLDDAQDAIQQQIPNLFDMAPLVNQPVDINMANLSSTVRLELSLWLRQQVAANVEIVDRQVAKLYPLCNLLMSYRVPTNNSSVESALVCTISAHDFHIVRAYVEEFGDLSILADIIGVVATTLDCDVLTSVADTLHYHHKAFGAIGAFNPLFQKAAMRYAAIRTVRFPDRELLIALADLSRTAQADAQLTQLLAYDLSRCEQKNSVAACSPVSDNMTEVMHNTPMDTDDEIDRILSSGTSMDQQIMTRVFGKITLKLEEQVAKNSVQSDGYASWFYRLRGFDEKAFDKLLTEWLSSLLMNHQGKLVLAGLPPLITSGCLTLSQFLATSRRCISNKKSSNEEAAMRMCVEVLNALLPSEHLNRLCQPQDAYRYRLEQRKFCQDSDGQVLQFIRETVESCSSQLSPTLDAQISSLLSSNRLRTIIRQFAVIDVQRLSKALGIGMQSVSEAVSSRIKSLLDGLLDPANALQLSQKTLDEQVRTVVDSADDLSLPFCQFELRQIFCANGTSSDPSDDTISAALLEAIKTAVEKDQSPWSDLVAGLDGELTSKIREHAEREILKASAFLSGAIASQPEASGRGDEAFLRKYLTVIDYTTSETPKDGQCSIFPSLVERLKGVVGVLGKWNNLASMEAMTSPPALRLCLWLNSLLQLSVVHISMASNKSSNQTQAAFLWSLRSLCTHPALEAYPSTTEYIFDVAVLFSDSISDEVRNNVAKLDATKPTDDPRCAFIFGSTPSPDGWLGLTKPVAPSTTPQAASSPQTQPQQSSQSQPQQQYQNQQFQSPTPATMQRSLSQQHQQQQAQAQAQARMYPQYPQHSQSNKMPPQFQRMAGQSPQQSQLQQMQQMQQMQGLAQQRATAPSPVQGQRQGPHPNQGQNPANKAGVARQEKPEMRPVPFALRRWEILPESGGNPAANETAISLSLFGARKV